MSVGYLVRNVEIPNGLHLAWTDVCFCVFLLLVFVVAKRLRKLFFLGGGLASINEASVVFLLLVVREFLIVF